MKVDEMQKLIDESENYIAFHVCVFGFFKTDDKFRFHANRKNTLKKILKTINNKRTETMENNNHEIELILDIINRELSMYDHLSRHDLYKADRAKALHTWEALDRVKKLIKNTVRREDV